MLAPVTDTVRSTVHSAESVLRPVQQAADEVLAGEEQRKPLTESIDRSLQALEKPLHSLLPEESAPAPEGRNSTDTPHGENSDDTGDGSSETTPPRDSGATTSADFASLTPEYAEHTASTGTRMAHHTGSVSSTPGSRSAPHAPQSPGPAPMPPAAAVVPIVSNGGGATDGKTSNGLVFGRPYDARFAGSFAGVAPGHGAFALASGVPPRPGSTPD